MFVQKGVEMEASLLQKINDDLKASMRERNELKTSTLRMLISAIKYAEMKKQDAEYNKHPDSPDIKTITLTDPEILGVVAKDQAERRQYRSLQEG